MIQGSVNEWAEPLIWLTLRAADGSEVGILFGVDTGFTGALTLPAETIASLGLPFRSRGAALLANGALDEFDVFSGVVVWNGADRQVLIETAESAPLSGMRLIEGHYLFIAAEPGGLIQIEPIDSPQEPTSPS